MGHRAVGLLSGQYGTVVGVSTRGPPASAGGFLSNKVERWQGFSPPSPRLASSGFVAVP